MKLYNRILSTLLAVMMMFGALAGLSVVGASAAEVQIEMTDDMIESTYTGTVYKAPEEKLAKMVMKMEKGDFQLWVDEISGEVAVKKVSTDEIMFSNPYDVASSGTVRTRKEILSQLVVQYVDNGARQSLNSFEEAAMRGQIKVMNIKNGIRVEYIIGREEARKLLPRWIEESSFKKFIDDPMKAAIEDGSLSNFNYTKFMTYYSRRGYDYKKSEKEWQGWLLSYPCVAEMNIYVFDSTVGDVKENWCESYIKQYCEDYTFEQMDADHELTGYAAENEKYPMFKMALEYSLGADGLSVRLPCNGLRYDMSTYTLESLTILPYMGAGNSTNEGYNFFPDGSGSLFGADQPEESSFSGKIYGVDYAYHSISGTYQKAIRYPVYGTVATETIYSYSYSYSAGEQGKAVVISETVSSTVKSKEDIIEAAEKNNGTFNGDITERSYKRGYLAIIESGESLAEISTYHAGLLSDYYTMKNYFNPKPKDTYDISGAISVGSTSTWTVVSNRKYTGSLKIRYVFLSDPDIAAEFKQWYDFDFYEASWLGMAEAYRDYLVDNEVLTKLTEEDVKEDIPLYVEVFGTLETQQIIATIPVNVMTPLTTFENVYQMYNDLAKQDVKNVNFKLTGFANGGMYATVPSSLKWEKAVGGADGFEWLIDEAKKIADADENATLGLYPDFDFAYIQNNTLFDAVNLKKDAIKTIDNRYTSLRQYSATQQSYISFHQLAVSPSRYSKFYEKLLDNYSKYDLKTLSIASLGSALNSDFDEDAPYNREDNKDYTIRAFEDMEEAGYSLMTDGGNAYTWKYVDHIINMDLDSSRHIRSSAAVPFLGAVLHGYVQFAGTPLNEEGDIDYAILKAIENGSSLYFILSYQNTNELKEDAILSQYYGIRYDIWANDMIFYYKELNALLKDVQTKVIIGHEFLTGERILDLDELDSTLADELQNALDEAVKNQESIEANRYIEIADAWRKVANSKRTVQNLYEDLEAAAEEIDDQFTSLKKFAGSLSTNVNDTLTEIANSNGNMDAFMVAFMVEDLNAQINTIRGRAVEVLELHDGLAAYKDNIKAGIDELLICKQIIQKGVADDYLSQEVAAIYLEKLDAAYNDLQSYIPQADQLIAEVVAKGYTNPSSSDYAVTVAVNSLAVLTNYTEGSNEQKLHDACVGSIFTADDILSEVEANKGETDSDDNQGPTLDDDEEVANNNRIVVVTYGDRNAETYEKTPYKTFILNYNNYTVRVTYGENTYTIASGDYVVIEHQN